MKPDNQKTFTQCLVDGNIFTYDLVTKQPYEGKVKESIGKGVVFSVDGVKQTSLKFGELPSEDMELLYFYKL